MARASIACYAASLDTSMMKVLRPLAGIVSDACPVEQPHERVAADPSWR